MVTGVLGILLTFVEFEHRVGCGHGQVPLGFAFLLRGQAKRHPTRKQRLKRLQLDLKPPGPKAHLHAGHIPKPCATIQVMVVGFLNKNLDQHRPTPTRRHGVAQHFPHIHIAEKDRSPLPDGPNVIGHQRIGLPRLVRAHTRRCFQPFKLVYMLAGVVPALIQSGVKGNVCARHKRFQPGNAGPVNAGPHNPEAGFVRQHIVGAFVHADQHTNVAQVGGEGDVLHRTQHHRLVFDLRLATGQAIGCIKNNRNFRPIIHKAAPDQKARNQDRNNGNDPDNGKPDPAHQRILIVTFTMFWRIVPVVHALSGSILFKYAAVACGAGADVA